MKCMQSKHTTMTLVRHASPPSKPSNIPITKLNEVPALSTPYLSSVLEASALSWLSSPMQSYGVLEALAL